MSEQITKTFLNFIKKFAAGVAGIILSLVGCAGALAVVAITLSLLSFAAIIGLIAEVATYNTTVFEKGRYLILCLMAPVFALSIFIISTGIIAEKYAFSMLLQEDAEDQVNNLLSRPKLV